MEENPLRRGLEAQRTMPPFAIVIFGATGDLTRRKLIPALFSLASRGFLHNFSVIGFARRPWSDEDFRTTSLKSPQAREFLSTLSYLQSDFNDPAGYRELLKRLERFPLVVYYLATPPEAYGTIIRHLGEADLTRGKYRIIIEKPFGHDLASARELNAKICASFDESQVFRIDHYLGKETVQNILVLRFGNSTYEPIWNSRYIHHVQITMAETLGIEGRGNYYEQAGAIRDIIQNHLLQLLALVAMEPPISLEANAVRNEKVKVLQSIRQIRGEHVTTELVRGQYTEGFVEGQPVKAYRREKDVKPDSMVETFAAVRVFLDTWRWSGVPFFLRAGKRLSRRLTEISIQFKQPPLNLFGSWMAAPQSNILTWRIQPDEGMRFVFNSKLPGFKPLLGPVHMKFAYGSSFGEESPEAYERLLLDVLMKDPTLFTRNDEIESAWNFTTQLVNAVETHAPDRLSFYKAGSAGPDEAQHLVAPSHTRWRRL